MRKIEAHFEMVFEDSGKVYLNGDIAILNPQLVMTKEEALVFAATIVCLAGICRG